MKKTAPVSHLTYPHSPPYPRTPNPTPPLCLSFFLSISLRVSDRSCYTSRLLEVLGTNLSQLRGCGEQSFITWKQTRPMASSRGLGGWGAGGRQAGFPPLLQERGWGGGSHQTHTIHVHVCICTDTHTHALSLTRAHTFPVSAALRVPCSGVWW